MHLRFLCKGWFVCFSLPELVLDLFVMTLHIGDLASLELVPSSNSLRIFHRWSCIGIPCHQRVLQRDRLYRQLLIEGLTTWLKLFRNHILLHRHALATLETLMACSLDLLFVEVLDLEAVLQASGLSLLRKVLHRQFGGSLACLANRIGSLGLSSVSLFKLLTIPTYEICLPFLRNGNLDLALRVLCNV